MPQRHPLPHPRTAGFTLIELLVVISIVALLIAMLLPALGKARATATIVICASIEPQTFLGLALYCNDNRSGLPPVNFGSPIYSDWGPRPSQVIMGANDQRMAYAGSPYGNYMGMGHVIAGNYYGNPDNLKPLFEPTARFPWWADTSLSAFQESYGFLWRTYRKNPAGNAHPSIIWSYTGYYYRGWRNSTLDANISPKLDNMGNKAALWDYLVDWGSQVRVPITHPNGYNVCHFDGHVSSFPDLNAELTFTNTYWSESDVLLALFDQRQ